VSAPPTKTASALEDYLGLFRALQALGVEFVVIGGGAVGAYARLVGDTVFSDDLDIFVTQRALETVVSDAGVVGAKVHKLPSPRSVPVALLEWNGREINLITSTSGLPPPDVVARTAREFQIGAPAPLSVLIADPFDLLRNKLTVNRPKDQPHIAILKRFLEEEAVHTFGQETDPRARIGTAERLLEVLQTRTLEQPLAERLLPLARDPVDFRFLAHRLPAEEMVRALLTAAPSDAVKATVAAIAAARGFSVR
jgi:hypothetical protein